MPNPYPSSEKNLIDIVSLKKYFPIRGGLLKRAVGAVRAVDDVTISIKRGETVGLVGESGCGKTTVGRAIMMLTPPTSGYVFLEAPGQVVGDFRRLVELRDRVKGTPKVPVSLADEILIKVDNLLETPLCDIKVDKKENLCADAGRLRRDVQGLGDKPLSSTRKESVLKIADAAIEDVARRYCINYLRKGNIKRLRRRIQFVFQDPFSSLDPKMLIKNIVAEPIRAQWRFVAPEIKRSVASSTATLRFAKEQTPSGMPRPPTPSQDRKGLTSKSELIRLRTIQLLEKVGLNVEHMYRFPHEFSGGQRQRIGIARALSVNPDFIVLDEPTSALDVSVQAQILNMLNELQRDFGLTYLFISHDLSTIKYMCDRVAVMYLGKIAEYASKKELFDKPIHPYTEALLSVIPVPDPELRRDRIILPGDVPSPANPPPGCRFHTRCPLTQDICRVVEPPLIDIGGEHFVACHVRAPDSETIKKWKGSQEGEAR
jgi:peptide/nickel transport system ATP-binding protein